MGIRNGLISSFLLVSAAALTACGPGSSLSREDAYKAFQGYSRAQVNGTSLGAAGASFNYTASQDCPDGGQIDVTLSASGDETAGVINADALYSACAVEDLTIDGALGLDMSFSNGGGAFGFSMDIVGNLAFSGEVNGTCDINLSADVSSTYDATSVNGSYSYSGSVCGYDIEELQAEFSASGSAG